MSNGWHVERLSERVWKAVESDPYGQYPFVYFVLGWDKIVVIDTGTGVHDTHALMLSIPELKQANLPFLVVLTHIHFDHVGGVKHFKNKPAISISRKSLQIRVTKTDTAAGSLGVCMSGADKTFSGNIEINSLALAHNGAKIESFAVDRWLNDGDVIALDHVTDPPTDHVTDSPTDHVLNVLAIPGHTPDSIALYFGPDKRMFIGDILYPFTAIHLDCIGSNVNSFVQSIDKLITYTRDRCQTSTSTTTAAPITTTANTAKIDQFISLVGLSRPAPFNVAALLTLVDDSVENAVALYFDAGGDVTGLVGAAPSDVPATSSDVVLSCGHVEANLSVQSLHQMKTALELIRAGVVPPSHVDGEYGEYTVENFTIMLAMKHAHQH